MKNSHIFWNVVIVIVMIAFPLMFVNVWDEIYTCILGINSLLLLATIADMEFKDEDEFQPLFLFFSFLGLILIGIILIVLFFVGLYKLAFIKYPIRFISNSFNNFNNWLDKKK